MHHPNYLTHRSDLTRKLDFVREQLALEAIVNQGNEAYSRQDWAAALEAFLSAEDKDFDGSRWTRDELEEAIANSRRGVEFEQHLRLARAAQQAQDWPVAMHEFRAALACHLPEFEPSEGQLRAELDWVSGQARPVSQQPAHKSTLPMIARKMVLPALLAGVAIALAWRLWVYVGSQPTAAPIAEAVIADAVIADTAGYAVAADGVSDTLAAPGQEAVVPAPPLTAAPAPATKSSELLTGAPSLPAAQLSWRGTAQAGQPVGV
ncbi:MAG: hypothetical protein OHK0039_41700 [Bacteroidia bacterium]